jgi:hypothetical protein
MGKGDDRGFAHRAELPDLPPHLVVRLKRGWRLDAGPARFVRARGDPVELRALLPKGARAVPQVPDLASRPVADLSASERRLARHVLVLLPRGSDVEAVQRTLAGLAAVEQVTRAPNISLP